MSSRAGKMEKQILKDAMPPQKTKSMTVGIDVNIAGEGVKTTYVVITGIPEDLPAEYESTVIRTAEAQFTQALNQRLWLEFYEQGKSAKDQNPVYLNLTKVDWLKVEKIYKVNN